jgi:hypothetical protein
MEPAPGCGSVVVAREFGVGWGTIMTVVRDHGRPLVDDPARLDHVGAMGLDEAGSTAATATSPTSFVTGIVDLTRRRGGVARLLDVVEGHSATRRSSPLAGRHHPTRRHDCRWSMNLRGSLAGPTATKKRCGSCSAPATTDIELFPTWRGRGAQAAAWCR